ncbi:unannotated protein [freshwater metagenome]|uniref:Unannotated protein n=1 Tax=freshwater metagenome TaxID=449393 RepID=A0A6J7E9F1_9ZZZZ|nr:HD domain-containing protein [Actinomycetota bacterium]
MLVRDLVDGQEFDQVFLVRAAEMRAKKDGGQFLKLTIGDRTGAFTVNLWDDAEAHRELCRAGSVVRANGTFTVDPKWGPQARARFTAAEPGSYDEAELRDGPPRSVDLMASDLRELVATVREPALQQLLEALLGEGTPTWEAFRTAPAAKYYHQAYVHGLLEHALSVAQAVSAISATFPGIDRDVAVTGALLHDIGKLEAYAELDGIIEMTDAGKLIGEIPLGYYRIRRAIEELPGFPPELAQAVLHIILSHHGALEHGSPVVPATREATLVHMIDNLGGRLGSFDRLERELAPGAAWSNFDRAIGGGAFFGGVSADLRERRSAA